MVPRQVSADWADHCGKRRGLVVLLNHVGPSGRFNLGRQSSLQLGATCAPTDRFDFRYLQQKTFGKAGPLLDSASEIPRRNSIEMVSVPSLNDGRNDLGSSVAETPPAGVILTICSFAVAAIFTRQRFLTLLTRTEGVRLTVGWWMELFGALGVLALGLAMLMRPEKDLTLLRGKKQSHNGLRISRGRPRNDALRAGAASK
jgi:hypothetical protein